MRLDSRVVVLIAALASACMQQPAADRETTVTDPEVQSLLGVAAAAGWDANAFSPLPTSGPIRVSKKGPASAPDANDAGLLVDSESGSRNWFFNRVNDGYRLACAGESIRGSRTWQRAEVTGGRPYQELLDINYVASDPGVCGTGLKPGLHGIYWGPNGIEQVDRDAVVRLRAQLEERGTANRCASLAAGGGQAFKFAALGLPETADFDLARDLPPEVTEAVNRFFDGACHRSAIAARRYGSDILLDVPTCALDGNRHVVYSPERRCIVGSFVWYIQG